MAEVLPSINYIDTSPIAFCNRAAVIPQRNDP